MLNKRDGFSMNTNEKIEILTKREYLVVKGNELVQKNRFELSLPEQKTVAYICSMIKPIDSKDTVLFQLEYEFNIRDYCKVCGIDYDNGKNYANAKAVLKRLSDRSMWLDTGDGEVLCRWLSKVWTNKRSGVVKIRIDEDLAPYLFDLKKSFTQYQLCNILAMKSAFSVRIYELMKSYAFQGGKVFELDELKRLLMVDTVKSYERFPDFRRYVLEIALKEINGLTDISLDYSTVKKGRKVVKLEFSIKLKGNLEQAATNAKVHGRLGNP